MVEAADGMKISEIVVYSKAATGQNMEHKLRQCMPCHLIMLINCPGCRLQIMYCVCSIVPLRVSQQEASAFGNY